MNKPRGIKGTLTKCGWCLYFTRGEDYVHDDKDGVCEIVESRVSAFPCPVLLASVIVGSLTSVVVPVPSPLSSFKRVTIRLYHCRSRFGQPIYNLDVSSLIPVLFSKSFANFASSLYFVLSAFMPAFLYAPILCLKPNSFRTSRRLSSAKRNLFAKS